MMIRFLDLTLLLLMAFLLEADLSIELEVGLPHGDPNQSEEASSQETWSLSLMPMSWSLSNTQGEQCSGAEPLDQLIQCFETFKPSISNVLVIPSEGVRVQRLVNALDTCARVNVPCVAGGGS